MKILFLCHAFNSLSQRLFVELKQAGHDVSVEYDINDTVAIEAVDLFKPDIIVAPFLKRAIPDEVWQNTPCLIVHPGIKGDRGPSSLDWALLNKETHWGVTVLQANAEMDAGDIWASHEFKMSKSTKASLYHNQVTEAAVSAMFEALEKFQNNQIDPEPLDYSNEDVRGQLRPLMQQTDRSINWHEDSTETVLCKIRCADGFPGVKDHYHDRELFLYDAREEQQLTGNPGEFIARCGDALCRATVDGAVWIGHMRDKQSEHPFKLPSAMVLTSVAENLPVFTADESTGYRDIWYEQDGAIGYLHFDFYNGAMGTEQCQRLRDALIEAKNKDIKILVLMGGKDYWSNGMHLNLIEASESAADESWKNINAIDDLALEIINTTDQLTISAIQGNVGAGGVFLARAADLVWARSGVILNPHYKDMGNLYGSEYWTYLLPRYAGDKNAHIITQSRLPMGTKEAISLQLVNEHFAKNIDDFVIEVKDRAKQLSYDENLKQILLSKNQQREIDEQQKSLQEYRDNELQRMHLNFYGFDPSYHVARYNFVYKIAKSRTPLTIAKHRRISELYSVD